MTDKTDEELELETLEIETQLVEAEVEPKPIWSKGEYYKNLFKGGK
ncbi:hypothetical protein ES703_47795 [subsurface metagenome]